MPSRPRAAPRRGSGRAGRSGSSQLLPSFPPAGPARTCRAAGGHRRAAPRDGRGAARRRWGRGAVPTLPRSAGRAAPAGKVLPNPCAPGDHSSRARAPAGRQSFRGPAPRAWHEGSAGGAAAAGAASGDQKLARAPNQGLKAPLRAHEYEAVLYICGPPGPGARRIGEASANREAAGRRAGRAAGRGVGRGERPEAAAAGAAPADMSAAPGRRGTEPGVGGGSSGYGDSPTF